MGGTDCAQPMIYAKNKRLEVDVFIVYTDCETWAGIPLPSSESEVHWCCYGLVPVCEIIMRSVKKY